MSINQYIPAGSEIVIARKTGNEWYTTKSDIPVTATEAVDCPVRNVPVLSTVHMGFRIWFLDGQVKVSLTDEQIRVAKNLRLQVLQYDIPTRVEGNVVHPSTYLWKCGVRTTKSCWLIPKGNMPLVRLRDLTRAGCNWSKSSVDPEEVVDRISEAVAGLQSERQRALKAADDGRRAAQERFDRNERDLALHVLQDNRRKDLERIEKTLKTCLENVKFGARALSIPVEWTESTSLVVRRVGGATTAASIARAVKEGAKKEAEDAGNVYDRAKALGTHEGNVIAEQIKNNTIPVEIAKDYVQEKEEEAGTFSLVSPEDKDGE